jgi:hypothetical protein
MKMFAPGVRCVVVAEDRGAECNIGATLTLDKRDDDDPSHWWFKDASRPLKLLPMTPDIIDKNVNWATESDYGHPECVGVIRQKHLAPLGDEDEFKTRTVALEAT